MLKLLCLADTDNGLINAKPNDFYGLDAGKIYRARQSDITETEGEKFVWVHTSDGLRNVRLARFREI